jgi:peptide/nickel transport system permease protein
VLNPRIGSEALMTSLDATSPMRRSRRDGALERLRLLIVPHRIIGGVVILFWVFCALFPGVVAPHDPIFDNQFPTSLKPTWAHPFGTDTNGDILSGSSPVAERPHAPAATLLGTVLDDLGL